MTRSVLLWLFVSLTACGRPSVAWLHIEAPLRVPEDANALRVEVEAAGSGKMQLERVYDLSTGPSFPLTLSLVEDEPLASTDRGRVVRVWALRDGTVARSWSHASREFELTEGHVVDVPIELCDCPVVP